MRFLIRFALAFCVAESSFASIHVQPSRTSFNPTVHDSVGYDINVSEAGAITVEILDRDTYVVKTLARSERVDAGSKVYVWDGTDAHGRIVPNEAWSVHVALETAHGTETFFPANAAAPMTAIKPDLYDVGTGILRYTLPVASRIHLQAGIRDVSRTNPRAGAVLKTIVNRAPRPAGAIVEQWTGMDESGSIYVPALKNFVVAIAATPLPEESVITYGNRDWDFLSMAVHRDGTPLLPPMPAAHHHGLTTLDDIAPTLQAQPRNAVWNSNDKKWTTDSQRLQVRMTPAGITAPAFEKQPGRLIVYVDDRCILDRPVTRSRDLSIDLPQNAVDHIVAVNWVSDYGPVAATSFRVQRAR